MKITLSILAFATVLLFTAFIPANVQTSTEPKIGIYGVCGMDSANKQIELILMNGNQFKYFCDSYPKGTVDVTGKWKVENNTVVLYDYGKVSIHNKWNIVDANCLRSTKMVGGGLMMLSVCHLESCK